MVEELTQEERMMGIKTVLFDLDGTLLPMDQDVFVKHYFGLLARKLAPYGYEQETLIGAIWKGTGAMVKNDGSCTNEEAFWNCFCKLLGPETRRDEPIFDEYYRKEFQAVQQVCGYTPQAAQTVARCKELGLQVALATNPIFPAVATQSRIRWAGLQPEDFMLYTTYENACFCKPNPKYYQAITQQLGADPAQCLMVGNDATEDLAASKIGMQVFLLTDCLINKEDKDISHYPHGSFPELMDYIEKNKE